LDDEKKSFQNILIFFAGLSVLGIEGCRDCEPTQVFLTDYGKTWIDYDSSQLTFKNNSGNSAIFTYSQSANGFVTSYFRGNECGDIDYLETINFSLTSTSLLYTFNFSLVAGSPGYGDGLNIEYIANSNISGDRVSFSFIFQNDTLSNAPEFIDIIDLNGSLFQNVYHSTASSSECPITDCYFSKQFGIIGFKITNGNIWSLR